MTDTAFCENFRSAELALQTTIYLSKWVKTFLDTHPDGHWISPSGHRFCSMPTASVGIYIDCDPVFVQREFLSMPLVIDASMKEWTIVMAQKPDKLIKAFEEVQSAVLSWIGEQNKALTELNAPLIRPASNVMAVVHRKEIAVLGEPSAAFFISGRAFDFLASAPGRAWRAPNGFYFLAVTTLQCGVDCIAFPIAARNTVCKLEGEYVSRVKETLKEALQQLAMAVKKADDPVLPEAVKEMTYKW
jgi:hypothetical protein